MVFILFQYSPNYYSYDFEIDQLPQTMPKLQTLIYRGQNVFPAPSVEFPWREETLDLPLNLSRTQSFNDHYANSLDIAQLSPNIYR